MSMVNKLQGTEVSPRTAFLSVVVMLALTAGVVAVVVKMLNGTPPAQAPRSDLRPGQHAALVQGTKAGKAVVAAKSDYSVIVKRNLFKPIGVVEETPPTGLLNTGNVKQSATTQTIAPFTPPKGGLPTGPPPGPSHPRMAYTGCVEMHGETYALLENLERSESQYTRAGGRAFGCMLLEIAPDMVTMEFNGEPFTLTLGANKVETPTTKPAAPPAQQGSGNGSATPPTPAAPTNEGNGPRVMPQNGPSGGGRRNFDGRRTREG